MFDYDTAMADTESHIFTNVNEVPEFDTPCDMEGWCEDE